jgi:hypothetical protein
MLEPIDDMPPGTAGFRAAGEVTRDEYESVLLPWMRQAVESGEPIRLLFQMGPGFEKFTPGALATDLTRAAPLGIRHWNAWRRMAVATDVGWARHAIELMGWTAPGELKLYGLDELDKAKAWLAEPLPD